MYRSLLLSVSVPSPRVGRSLSSSTPNMTSPQITQSLITRPTHAPPVAWGLGSSPSHCHIPYMLRLSGYSLPPVSICRCPLCLRMYMSQTLNRTLKGRSFDATVRQQIAHLRQAWHTEEATGPPSARPIVDVVRPSLHSTRPCYTVTSDIDGPEDVGDFSLDASSTSQEWPLACASLRSWIAA
jgi:hypothetical protein